MLFVRVITGPCVLFPTSTGYCSGEYLNASKCSQSMASVILWYAQIGLYLHVYLVLPAGYVLCTFPADFPHLFVYFTVTLSYSCYS